MKTLGVQKIYCNDVFDEDGKIIRSHSIRTHVYISKLLGSGSEYYIEDVVGIVKTLPNTRYQSFMYWFPLKPFTSLSNLT